MDDDCNPTMTTTEPDRFQYTAWAFDHGDELREALQEAGASDALLRFIGEVEPGTRHSVLMTLFRHHGSAVTSAEEANAPNPEDCEEAYHCGGGFFTKLWDGHVADAFCHADRNNRPLMKRAFTHSEIVERGLTNDGPFRDRDYLTNLINEKW